MTGRKDFNYPLFIKAAKLLRERGYDIITPVEINPPPDEEDEYGEWWPLVSRDLHVIWRNRDKMKGIVVLPEWRHSVGSRMEHEMIVNKLHGKCRRYEDIKKGKS